MVRQGEQRQGARVWSDRGSSARGPGCGPTERDSGAAPASALHLSGPGEERHGREGGDGAPGRCASVRHRCCPRCTAWCLSRTASRPSSECPQGFKMPTNVRATTLASEAIIGAQYAVHAVPVQSSRAFLHAIKDVLPANVPIICVSKGLEVGSGQMMSELVPSALERKQPAVFLSGPSFAREVMQNRPTGVVAACRDGKLARTVQALFASPTMRVNMTTDVVGVEICGALKNVLAIAAGIVEGMDLGHNALAALVAQGCSEIRWELVAGELRDAACSWELGVGPGTTSKP